MLITEDSVIEEEKDNHWVEQFTEWVSPLAGMWDAIGKPVDAKRLSEYQRVFSEIPHGLLSQMVDRAIRDNGAYQSVPTIGACWEALKKVLRNPFDVDAAIETWIEKQYQSCIYKFE